jgi:molybdate transport system substrate-binding protein
MREYIPWLVLLVIVVAAVAVFVGIAARQERSDVFVLCGGSFRQPLDEADEMYKQASEDVVTATYGGSAVLCAQLENTGRGDILICHDPYMPWAEDKGLIERWATVAYADIVIVVPKENPHNIQSLQDLTKEGLRVGVGDPRYSTSGVIVKNLLDNVPYGDEIRENVAKTGHGHQQRCTEVQMGSLDAGFVWNGAAHLFKDALKAIPIPGEHIDAVTSATFGKTDLSNIQVTVGLTKVGAGNASAGKFYEFLADKKQLFVEHGFRPVGEDL